MFVDALYLWYYFRENVWHCGFDPDFVEKEMIGQEETIDNFKV